jgi:phytoene/squalene synthetase
MEALLTESSVRISVTEAYERCERLAKTHYENFNVGSRLLPSEKKKIK